MTESKPGDQFGSPGGPAITAADGGPGRVTASVHTADELVPEMHIEIGDSLARGPLKAAMVDGRLALEKLTPEILKQCDRMTLRELMVELSQLKVDLTGFKGLVRDQRHVLDRWAGHPLTVNLAALVALKTCGADQATFLRLVAACPEKIVPYLTDESCQGLTPDSIAAVVKEMRADKRMVLSDIDMRGLGMLTARYMSKAIGGDLKRGPLVVDQIVHSMTQVRSHPDALDVGFIAGAAIAGLVALRSGIAANRAASEGAIDRAVTLQWATFGLMFNTWGTVASALVVTIHAFHTFLKENPMAGAADCAEHLLGKYQAEWLQAPPAGWEDRDVTRAIELSDAVVKANAGVRV